MFTKKSKNKNIQKKETKRKKNIQKKETKKTEISKRKKPRRQKYPKGKKPRQKFADTVSCPTALVAIITFLSPFCCSASQVSANHF